MKKVSLFGWFNIIMFSIVFLSPIIITSCGPSAKEIAEKEFQDSIKSTSSYVVSGSIVGLKKFRNNEYFVIRHEYGDFLVPVSHDDEIKNELSKFSDYVKLREQRVRDSVTIVNNQIEIKMLKKKINVLNQKIKMSEQKIKNVDSRISKRYMTQK